MFSLLISVISFIILAYIALIVISVGLGILGTFIEWVADLFDEK